MTPTIDTPSISETIEAYIRERFLYDRPEIELTGDLPLIEQRLIDSLQLMQLVSFLQEQFGIAIDITELVIENFTSINTMAEFVARHRR